MLQLVEEVRTICEMLNSCTKLETKYGAARMGSKCNLPCRRYTEDIRSIRKHYLLSES